MDQYYQHYILWINTVWNYSMNQNTRPLYGSILSGYYSEQQTLDYYESILSHHILDPTIPYILL